MIWNKGGDLKPDKDQRSGPTRVRQLLGGRKICPEAPHLGLIPGTPDFRRKLALLPNHIAELTQTYLRQVWYRAWKWLRRGKEKDGGHGVSEMQGLHMDRHLDEASEVSAKTAGARGGWVNGAVPLGQKWMDHSVISRGCSQNAQGWG